MAAAQRTIISSCRERPSNVQQEEWLEWLEDTATDGLPQSLKLLRTSNPSRYLASKKLLNLNRVYRNPAAALRHAKEAHLSSGVNCLDWINWEKSFLHFAAATGSFDLVKSMLDRRPDLLDKQDDMGQTPLLLALQSGDLHTVQYLIAQGADCRKWDVNTVTAMHWATMLDGEERKTVIFKLKERCAPVDVGAKIVCDHGQTPSHLIGTPLMWAISLSDPDAVDALLEVGADPTCRPFGQDNGSPFEVACQLHESQILKKFLSIPKVRSDVMRSRPLVHEGPSPLVQPLFFALSSVSRWDRLIRHGSNYEHNARETIRLLIEAGASCECVLHVQRADFKQTMSATFATAWHGCNPDIMKSGLQLGFKEYIESTFGSASSGGTPLFAAITDRHYEMFTILLENGANVNAKDKHGSTPMHRAAKENDDTFFVEKLAEYGAPIDAYGLRAAAPFYVATYCGNLRVAKWLWEHGANRDDTENAEKRSILAKLLSLRTRNAAERIKFILSLPDRDGSDGFIVFKLSHHHSSAFHFAVAVFTEDPDAAEITRIVISLLLTKYHDPKYLNSTSGPHHDTCLGMAVEVGNYKVMQLLLEAGADPNIQDEYGRTPLDKAYWRYCYPSLTPALTKVDVNDRLAVRKTLDYVNRNTSEILSLLTKTYNAKPNFFRFPTWHGEKPGYRDLEWVLERLKENRVRDASRTGPVNDGKPI